MSSGAPALLFHTLPAGASKGYKNLREPPSENAAKCRAYIDSLWERFRPFADSHFPQDFAVHTHQRFWEMYVGVSLLDAGHVVVARKPGPDFGVTLADRRVWIEAVAATPGETGKPDSVPQIEPREGVITSGYVPQDKIVLRCTSAIAAKFPTQFQRHLDLGIISPDDCYVIAVNHAEVYHFVDVGSPPYILRAVLGLGSHFVTINRNTREISGQGIQYRGSVAKATGVSVGTSLFLSHESAPVSALIGSVTTIGTPVHLGHHQMGQDFRLIHNPMARNALPDGLLRRGQDVHVALGEHEFTVSGQELSG